MYQAVASFGAFAFGAGIILYASYSVVAALFPSQFEKDELRRYNEYYRKRGDH